ncbi:hypothetical protein CQ062_13675 [Ochrobactrum sp. MYb68]|nr:hypothetical protein CQ062_13675 [Ochrobactrum sp. MYb68]
MAKIKTGGPAFPVTFEGGSNNGETPFFHEGMTLRDYIAAKALHGFLSSEFVSDFNKEIGPYRTDADIRRNLATNAYLYADAMIAAREGGAK